MRFGINGPNAIDEFLVKTVSRPSWSLTESSHVFLNHTFYYPGRVSYSEVSFTLVDPVDVDAAWRILKLIEDSGYTIPTSANIVEPAGRSTVSKKKSVEAFEEVNLVQLDAEGNELETWKFVNPWIKEIAFSELSYEDDSLTTIDVTMRFDRCVYDPGGKSDRDTLFDTNLSK